MAKINLQDIYKKYDKTMALNGLNLQIEDKEIVVFLGPSGCGKTTTLDCIAGINQPTSGRVYFNDKDVTDQAPHKRNVSMVFQSALLYPHLTGRENIRMSLRIGRNSREVEDRKIEEVVNLLSIRTQLDKLPYQMSGGERQRVATAKAIVRNPSVFLMDEPFASLDAAMKEELRVEIVVLQKKLGITMILVTHDQVEAMTMGDHIAVIKEGILQQVGTPDEIYNMPANVFVGGFVGSPSMNFFQVSVKKGDNSYIFEHPKFHIELSKKRTEYFGKFLEEKKSVIIGLRPQHVTFLEKPEQGVLRGQIYAIERLGKETRVTVDYGGKDKLKALMSPLFSKTMGDVVYMLPKVEDLYFFDSEKEKKLLFKLDQTLNDK